MDEPLDNELEACIEEEVDATTQTARFKCNRCDHKVFKHKKRAVSHARTHFATPERTCPRCGRVLTTADKKDEHVDSVHNKECIHCAGRFDGARSMRNHMNSTACGFFEEEALGNISVQEIQDFPYEDEGLLGDEDMTTSEDED